MWPSFLAFFFSLFQDFYGGAYGHPHPAMFNAYNQPIPLPAFLSQMPMCPQGSMEPLPVSIQFRLDQLCATGFCDASEIDDRCRKFMREVPEPVAIQAIEEFSTVDRTAIRKVSAYLMVSFLSRVSPAQAIGFRYNCSKPTSSLLCALSTGWF